MENVSAEDIMDTIRSAAREHIRTSQESVRNSERLVKLVGERGTSYEDYRKAQVKHPHHIMMVGHKNTIRGIVDSYELQQELEQIRKEGGYEWTPGTEVLKTSNVNPKENP
ncbi:MAG: hypothetical protein CM15mV26_1110 [uncultured marine virus]|nr:MAG: hypothetical protein CM15mV26_1110 [uncultured marine virus]